ncbi:MAG: TylF/MycF/NovP-related O-methyltransferase [Acidimicrobiales bacterium]|nr:TylF/MycF/NovP-related O-methyltransferase [Acidimicrobiales bacterium]
MKQLVTRPLRRLLAMGGYDVVRTVPEGAGRTYPPDFDDDLIALCERVRPYTLTSPERIAALRDAVRHVVRRGVPGAFVECGVWRGGSMMVVALTLREMEVDDRELVLFDTFTHMPFPGPEDVDLFGRPAADAYDAASAAEAFRYLPFEEVQAALAGTGYPVERTRFVPGLVEDTIPDEAPEEIALCRLDTDWYQSTRHEMEHLFGRIRPGGILIVDDYGHFMGAKQAVDEYFAAHGPDVLLHRIDFTGRLVVVPPR